MELQVRLGVWPGMVLAWGLWLGIGSGLVLARGI